MPHPSDSERIRYTFIAFIWLSQIHKPDCFRHMPPRLMLIVNVFGMIFNYILWFVKFLMVLGHELL